MARRPPPLRERAIRNARLFVGVTEQPPGSNRGPNLIRGDRLGGIDFWNAQAGVPYGSQWCMAFVRGMYRLAGATIGGGASVGNFLAWARANGDVVYRPYHADLACYDWNGDGWPDHVEFVVRVLAVRWRHGRFVGWVKTIGGNTSDAVRYRYRWVADCQFARIPG